MARMKAKTKKWFKIGGMVIAAVLTLGAVTTIASRCESEDEKTLSTFDYEIGALSDTDGKKVKNDKSGLVSKDMYAIGGLSVDLEKDADVMYQLNFYDEEKAWVSQTTYKRDFDDSEVEALKAQGIAYVRVEIIPLEDEDETVSLLEKRGYVKQVTVTVEEAEEKEEEEASDENSVQE